MKSKLNTQLEQYWRTGGSVKLGKTNTPIAFFSTVHSGFSSLGSTGSGHDFDFQNCTTILPDQSQFNANTGKVALWNAAERAWNYANKIAYGYDKQGFSTGQITLPVDHTNYLFNAPAVSLTKPKLNEAKTAWIEGADLAGLKQALKTQNQQRLNQKIDAGLDFESTNYQINDRSRDAFSQTLSCVNAELITAPIQWRSTNNQMQTLSLEKFKQLAQAVFEAYTGLLKKYWRAEDKISALTTKSAAQSFKVNEQWN